jgi:hypothetical protein
MLSQSDFDLEELVALIKDAISAEYVSAVRRRTEYLREQRPNDLTVLFLAALSIGLDGDEEESYVTLLQALEIARRQGVSCTDRLRYLFAFREWFPEFPEIILGEKGGLFDVRDEAREVERALKELDPDLGRRLALSWALRDLVKVCEDYVDALPSATIGRFLEITEAG